MNRKPRTVGFLCIINQTSQESYDPEPLQICKQIPLNKQSKVNKSFFYVIVYYHIISDSNSERDIPYNTDWLFFNLVDRDSKSKCLPVTLCSSTYSGHVKYNYNYSFYIGHRNMTYVNCLLCIKT